MQRALLAIILLLSVFACQSSSENSVSGHIERFDADTIFVGRRYKFLITNAEQPNFDQMVVGTPVTIYFNGKYNREGVNHALRIEPNTLYLQLLGSWIEVEGSPSKFEEQSLGREADPEMGFELLPFDNARSIGMKSIAFKSWRITKEGKLQLTGLVHGSNSTNFSEDWNIEHIDDQNLVISQEDISLRFIRDYDEQTIELEETEL